MSTRERSFWGWGYADKFPDAEGRRAIGEHAVEMLGFEGLDPADPPVLEAISIPKSGLPIPEGLRAICTADDAPRIRHTYGRAFCDVVRGFSGDFSGAPDLVARPTNEDEIAEILNWCTQKSVAVIPYGGGTSVVGGVEMKRGAGFEHVLCLDVGALDRVLEVDPVSRLARIQAGATGPVLEAQLAAEGHTLRHYPQSYEFSTLGGWIATRAGGHYATLRTHIDDFVASTRMLAPSGVFESRCLPGSGAGPSPDRLVIGSEGILGVITEAWMRVTKKPSYRAKAAFHFATLEAATEGARHLCQSGLHPSNCRLLDPTEAQQNFVAMDGSTVLLVGFESADHSVRSSMERAIEICKKASGKLSGEPKYVEATEGGHTAEAGAWRNAFFEMPYMQNVMVSLGVIADTFETACTWSRFSELHAAVTDAVRTAMGAEGGRISMRFTHVYPDGPAPYYTFLTPSRRPEMIEKWGRIKKAASDAILANGGTITHHHAVGRTHRPWYDRQRPDIFASGLAAAKSRFDPAGVLNPGVLIDVLPASSD